MRSPTGSVAPVRRSWRRCVARPSVRLRTCGTFLRIRSRNRDRISEAVMCRSLNTPYSCSYLFSVDIPPLKRYASSVLVARRSLTRVRSYLRQVFDNHSVDIPPLKSYLRQVMSPDRSNIHSYIRSYSLLVSTIHRSKNVRQIRILHRQRILYVR